VHLLTGRPGRVLSGSWRPRRDPDHAASKTRRSSTSRVPGESLLGPNHHLNVRAQLTNTIVGANVTVKHPIRITNSLLFDNCCVDSLRDLEQFIVTPETIVDCKQSQAGADLQLWAATTEARA